MRHRIIRVVLYIVCAAAFLTGCGERSIQGDPWDHLGHHLR